MIGSKLYKEDLSITDQVDIPNQDRVRLASSNLNQVVVSGGVPYYWDGANLGQLKNWVKGEDNAPPDGTSFDLSNISDCTRHLNFSCMLNQMRLGS